MVSKKMFKVDRADRNEGDSLLAKVQAWKNGKSPWFNQYDIVTRQMVKVKKTSYKDTMNPKRKPKEALNV